MSADRTGTAPAAPTARISRIECSLHNDPRLLASLGSVFAHAAKRAGLSEETQGAVEMAAVDGASEALIPVNANGSVAPTIKLVVEEFSDRVELALETPAGARVEGFRKRLAGKIPDRIRCEERDGRFRITLLKSCGAAKSNLAV